MYGAVVQVRRARALMVCFEGMALWGCNYLNRSRVLLDQVDLDMLTQTNDWTTAPAVFSRLSYHGPHRLNASYGKLVNGGLLTVAGTEAAQKEQRFESSWTWGHGAGAYHFSIKDPGYMPPAMAGHWIYHRLATTPMVPMVQDNKGCQEVVPMDRPPLKDGPFPAMEQRRSWRGFADEPLALDELRDCLCSGLMITGFVDTGIDEQGRLPVKMAPAGGARNPYEGYVLARNVEGLKPGIYHYAGVDNTLGLVYDGKLPPISELVGAQTWFDNAAAIIFLVANFERTVWKYPHPTSYRVVLIEAGHIAQNMLLAATHLGLASAPTCAINDGIVEGLLNLDPVMQSAVYTVSVGKRTEKRSEADVEKVHPNPHLPS